ncbi:MAG: class I SAM-dependent methyltransferase [Sedimentitalea sp.]|uniref:class I SAM-dependent DNA methyltransferase n=1 Tax=Sedimentitalea sp. TaxID=2048915 RepID=UPI003264F1C0
MKNQEHSGPLAEVYNAQSPQEIAAHYDAWAGAYDKDMSQAGYRHPSVAVALLARHLQTGAAPILDAGAGTGLVGAWLGILGYPTVDGVDISKGMLEVAAAKGGYRNLHCLALGNDLPFNDGAYQGVISTGVFTTGHVGTEALPELARITASGGTLVITVKETLWIKNFAAAVADDDKLALIAMTEPYVSMPEDAATAPSRAVVLQRA